jgi:transcriptional regulator with XRE-family HTH domain
MVHKGQNPLRKWRIANEVVQADVAKKLGKPVSLISMWESNWQYPGDKNLELLATLMGVPVVVLTAQWNKWARHKEPKERHAE